MNKIDGYTVYSLYVIEQLSTVDIGKRLGVSYSTIRRFLLKYNLLRSPAEGVRLASYKIGLKQRGKKVTMTEEWRKNISIGQIKRWEKQSKGYILKPSGYYEITRGENKGRMLHDVIYEHFYNLKLNKDDVVHHINEIKTDNDIRNLTRMTKSEHCSLHANKNYLKRKRNMKGQFV